MMKPKKWGLSSCAECRSLGEAEVLIEKLRHVATERTIAQIDAIRTGNQEDITDHALWHADHAPSWRKRK